MKNKIIFTIGLIILAFSFYSPVFAADVSLTIRDGATIILPVSLVAIQPGDTVLSVLSNADSADPTWSVDIQHYSFGDYLKCITSVAGNHCENWQYTLNSFYPFTSIDQNPVSAGDVIYIYFGPQNRIILNSANISANDTLIATSQKYDYQNDSWIIRTGVTIGVTQTNPADPFSPIEIFTSAVDSSGQAVFSSIPADSYGIGVKEDFYFPLESLTVTTPPPQGGGGIIFSPPAPAEKVKFSSEKAFEFLISQQKENGSFGEDLYTDWIALSFSSSEKFQEQKTKLVKYFENLKTKDYQLTDYERHAMALMSLGLNPYDANGENYVKKITDSFDGKQFGDANQDNDDIFALIVLQNAGFTQTEKMIADDLAFILDNQKKNGSWDESADMTGAGIGALSTFSGDERVKNALEKAKDFLKQNQKNDAGFGNVSSTAWAIEGILALSEKPEDWVKNNNTPLDYLAGNQDSDGGTKNNDIKSKLWETAYTLTALSGKTWNQIMQKFEKPQPARNAFSVADAGGKTAVLQKMEEKSPVQKIETPKKIIKKTVQKAKIQNTENLANQNTAAVISSLETKNPEPVKKSQFMNLQFSPLLFPLYLLFGVF